MTSHQHRNMRRRTIREALTVRAAQATAMGEGIARCSLDIVSTFGFEDRRAVFTGVRTRLYVPGFPPLRALSSVYLRRRFSHMMYACCLGPR